mmetsp:Transcript_65435/g.210963  ORF Transcript_65435/g.210963 Transcript_65435/m.210963 type:complete len:141 (-) Transcript_65435:633-1055(-)
MHGPGATATRETAMGEALRAVLGDVQEVDTMQASWGFASASTLVAVQFPEHRGMGDMLRAGLGVVHDVAGDTNVARGLASETKPLIADVPGQDPRGIAGGTQSRGPMSCGGPTAGWLAVMLVSMPSVAAGGASTGILMDS